MSRKLEVRYGRGSTSMNQETTARGSEKPAAIPEPKEVEPGRMKKQTNVRGSG